MFDRYIREVGQYEDGLRAEGRLVRKYKFTGSAEQLKERLPVRIGPQANQGILLREDTFVELGGPDEGSCGCFLITDDPSLIMDGRTTLIGPDIQESSRSALPFGQVVMAGGAELNYKEPETLQHLRFIGDQIEGYMLRSLPQSLWCRVSKNAAARGFNFEVLGRALMAVYKSQNIKIEAVEIIFITSSKKDVMRLAEIEAQAQKNIKQMREEYWKSKGYDINCGLDCRACVNKEVCEELRTVLRSRRRAKSA